MIGPECVWYRARYTTSEQRYRTPRIDIYYTEYHVLKHTPCGVWLDDYGRKRFVLRDARKRWACPTREEARESMEARMRRRETILTAQLASVKKGLAALKDGEVDDSEGRYTMKELPNTWKVQE